MYVAFVAPVIRVPPELLFVVLEYHWYDGLPTPFMYPTSNGAAIVPPAQIIWYSVGLVLIIGSACTIIAAGLDVICPHPPLPANVKVE